jgi:hypothetical protein
MKIAFEIDDKDIRNCIETISSFISETGVTFQDLQGMLLSLFMKRQTKKNSMDVAAAAKKARKAKAKPKRPKSV